MGASYKILIFTCLGFFSSVTIGEDISPDRRVVVELLKRHSNYNEKEVLEHYNDCDDDNYKWQVLCANYNYTRSDMRLNTTYKNLIDKIKGSSAERKLIVSQRAWLTFRDLSCKFENDSFEGLRISYLTQRSCETVYSDEREKRLSVFLECESADCPGGQE